MCVISKLLQKGFQEHRIKSHEQHGYSINYGIKTGYNDAFIIDNETKDALIREDTKSAEIIKPVLRGRDIKRYQAQWAGLWLIMTLPSLKIDIDSYPAIKSYLLSFGKDRLEQAGKTLADGSKSRKKTPHQWFELQDTCAYHAEFKRDKIIWGNLSVQPRFAVDNDSSFISAPTNLLTGTNHIKYIAGVLNSQFCYWCMRQLAYSREQGYMEYKKVFVEQIPVPKETRQNYPLITQIGNLAEQILIAKKKKLGISKLEYQIDALVYQLYELTANEINVITNI